MINNVGYQNDAPPKCKESSKDEVPVSRVFSKCIQWLEPVHRSSWSRWEASLDGCDADPKEYHTPEGNCPHGPRKADLGY
jgi:hypothetical protein